MFKEYCMLFISILPYFHKLEHKAINVMHPFYVSVIEINHNTSEKTAEISIRIFTEDLEVTLRKYGHTKVDILHPVNKAETDKLLNDYIQHKLQIKIEGKPVTMQYLGYEQQMESIWTYLEVKDVNTMYKVSANCNLLYDYQQKQSNIFHIKSDGKERSFKLDYPNAVFSE